MVRVSRSLGVVLSVILLGTSGPAEAKTDVVTLVKSATSATEITRRLKRYVPVKLGLPMAKIAKDIRPLLAPLKRASDHIDAIFWQQASADGARLLRELLGSKAPAAVGLARMMKIHYGVWDRHHNDEAFIGNQPRPAGANFYPADLSRREVEDRIKRKYALAEGYYSPYTVLVRKGDKLVAVPYRQAYRKDLAAAATDLREAAASYRCSPSGANPCPCAALAKYLEARAKSFGNDDYRTSEFLWMQATTCPLDIVIGPYEYYEDRLMGLKTAYEAIITYRNDVETKRFAKFLPHDNGLFLNLPVSAQVRERFQRIKATPITVADVLYTAGDARAGYQIRAVHLPNDPAVRKARGTKKFIFRNVVKAKFDTLVKPVAKKLFSPKYLKKLSFKAYFNMLLMWQLAHQVVPGKIVLPDKTRTTARQRLRERYDIVNYLKGEAIALLNYFYFRKQGVLAKGQDAQMAVTYLASLFDTVRLARGSPSSLAKTIMYNYLAHEWVFRYNSRTKTFEVNADMMSKAVRKLSAEALDIIARGDYDGAGRLVVEYGIVPPEMRQKLAAMSALPVDISPQYVTFK